MKQQKKNIRILLILFFLAASFLFISPAIRKPRSSFHSNQLTKKTTEIDDNTIRIDYVDADDNLAIAADLGYATMMLTQSANSILEQYFDEKGEPINTYNGYYSILREYDECGNNTRITYLNRLGDPMIMVNGYAIEEKEYNEKNRIVAVRYYDIEMNPIQSPLYGFGETYRYNEQGKIDRITFIDSSGNPMITRQGYACVTRSYEKDRVKCEMYLNEKEEPICLALGQYGVQKEYDKYGRVSVLTYLNAKGDPIITNKGFTTIKRTYHANGSIATEQYYDIDGEPFALSEGQYGISQDEKTTVYLNKNGLEVFNLKNHLYNHSWLAIPTTIFIMVLCSLTNKKWHIIFLAFYICAIIYLTLMYRESNSNSNNLKLLWSYKRIFVDSEARADIFKNIWLFIPLGTILYHLHPKKRILIIPIVFSIFLECIQLVSRTGFCELDDIISNSVGGAMGYAAGKLTVDIKQRIKSWKHIYIGKRR